MKMLYPMMAYCLLILGSASLDRAKAAQDSSNFAEKATIGFISENDNQTMCPQQIEKQIKAGNELAAGGSPFDPRKR